MKGFFNIDYCITGFALKLDDDSIFNWGDGLATEWENLHGPILGFQFKLKTIIGNRVVYSEFGIILGDECTPKYF